MVQAKDDDPRIGRTTIAVKVAMSCSLRGIKLQAETTKQPTPEIATQAGLRDSEHDSMCRRVRASTVLYL